MKNRSSNLFNMEANFNDEWSSDNKEKPQKKVITKIETPQKHQLYFSKEKRRSKVVIIVQPTRKNYIKAYLSHKNLYKPKQSTLHRLHGI